MWRIPKLDFSNPIFCDAGCADKKKAGYIGIDVDEHGQEILWDLRNGIPLPDESVQDLHACHLLEHFTNKESKAFITEAQRVLVKGGTLTAIQPYAMHATALYPDHESFWNEARVQSIQRNEPGWEIMTNYNDVAQLIFILKKI